MSDQAIKDMNFETALGALEKIVSELEQGNIPLDQAVTKYEEGVALKQHCEQQLAAATARIEQITVGDQGEIKADLFDEAAES